MRHPDELRLAGVKNFDCECFWQKKKKRNKRQKAKKNPILSFRFLRTTNSQVNLLLHNSVHIGRV
jgi:hypothetical protein